jgi:uncharacterized protein YbgA (DUF1722 family)
MLLHIWWYLDRSVSSCNRAQFIDKSKWRRVGDTELVKEKVAEMWV